ncbi:hypothetical protein AMECASPLE_035661, partial [Ameca splendens]
SQDQKSNPARLHQGQIASVSGSHAVPLHYTLPQSIIFFMQTFGLFLTHQQIYQSLAPELKAMVESGQVRIEIQSFSLGSVVVNFSIIFNQSPGQAMGNLSSALLHALMNSSKFIVDVNNTSINDFDECTLGENDCSQRATCINTWASYTCICLDGFIDNNPERSGRNCQANEVDTTSTPGVSTISSTTTVPTFAQTTTSSETTNPVLVTSSNASHISTALPSATVNNIPSTITAPTTAYSAPTITVTTQTSNIAPTLVINASAIQSAARTKTPGTTFNPAVLSTNPITTAAPITTTVTVSAINATHTTTTSSQVISFAPTTTTLDTAVGITTPSTISSTLTTPSSALRSATNYSLEGALSVQCRVAAITVTLAKAFLMNAKIQESSLYLGFPWCEVNGGNATHVELTVAWNECAIRLVNNETTYTASVTLFNTMDPYRAEGGTVEVPRIRLEVPIVCTYMKSMLISSDLGYMG